MTNKQEAARLILRAISLLPLSEQQGYTGRTLRSIGNQLKAETSNSANVFNPTDGSIGDKKSLQFDPATGQMSYLSKKDATSILRRLDRAIEFKQNEINKVQSPNSNVTNLLG